MPSVGYQRNISSSSFQFSNCKKAVRNVATDLSICDLHKHVIFILVINYCKPNPCKYGGQCVKRLGGFRCRCRPGYTGVKCATGRLQPCLTCLKILQFNKLLSSKTECACSIESCRRFVNFVYFYTTLIFTLC